MSIGRDVSELRPPTGLFFIKYFLILNIIKQKNEVRIVKVYSLFNDAFSLI
jgi:hypothetical protein